MICKQHRQNKQNGLANQNNSRYGQPNQEKPIKKLFTPVRMLPNPSAGTSDPPISTLSYPYASFPHFSQESELLKQPLANPSNQPHPQLQQSAQHSLQRARRHHRHCHVHHKQYNAQSQPVPVVKHCRGVTLGGQRGHVEAGGMHSRLLAQRGQGVVGGRGRGGTGGVQGAGAGLPGQGLAVEGDVRYLGGGGAEGAGAGVAALAGCVHPPAYNRYYNIYMYNHSTLSRFIRLVTELNEHNDDTPSLLGASAGVEVHLRLVQVGGRGSGLWAIGCGITSREAGISDAGTQLGNGFNKGSGADLIGSASILKHDSIVFFSFEQIQLGYGLISSSRNTSAMRSLILADTSSTIWKQSLIVPRMGLLSGIDFLSLPSNSRLWRISSMVLSVSFRRSIVQFINSIIELVQAL